MSDILTKVLEEYKQKLRKAEALEATAVVKEKQAAQERDETRDLLAKTRIERQNIDTLNTAKEREFKAREDDLKNREAALLSKQVDLERKIVEQTVTNGEKIAELNARTVALEKAEQLNKVNSEQLGKVADRYKAIAELISRA